MRKIPMYFTESEQQIVDRFDDDISRERWRDYKWQLKHCVKDIETF